MARDLEQPVGPVPSVLIVDDSAIVLKIARRTLEQAGFKVVTLDTPFGTAREVMRLRPDLVLVDLRMPGLDGGSLVRTLKTNPELRSTRVALFSDSPPEDLEVAARNCGADGYIEKGVGAALPQHVRQLIGIAPRPPNTP